MTPLETRIRTLIETHGPLPVSDFMAECLYHPAHGHYTSGTPLGAAGDFTTAPEISQMFGELIGLSLAQAWLDQGRPAPFTLAELGPGRGTLMADILKATTLVPGFRDAADLHLVEISPRMKTLQEQSLAGEHVTWLETAAALPAQPLFLIANEFFDALPIRQFSRSGPGWAERRIGLREGKLEFGLATPTAIPALTHRLDDTRDGDLVEHCPTAAGIVEAVGQRIANHGGAGLIIDYGDWRSLGDTLQALYRHALCDPLEHIGACDLTAHVDFQALAEAAPCAFTRLTSQGVFLERLGITPRALALAKGLSGPALDAHIAAHRRLTHPDEMGTLFKVLGLYPATAMPPPGLEP